MTGLFPVFCAERIGNVCVQNLIVYLILEEFMQRNHSIDLLRVMATLAVITIHVSTAPLGNASPEVYSSVFLNMELIHILMQWSVPVFFMITGFCSMQKDTCSYSYCFSKVLKYIGVLFTVGLFYALLEEIFKVRTFSFTMVINALKCVISGSLWEHMWFVYSIIGIYLILPVVHCFMQQGEKNIYILTGLLLFFTILSPAIGKYIMIGVEFPFTGYLFYVCFGGMAAKCKIDKKWEYPAYFVIAVSIVYLFINVGKELFVFKHPLVCFMAMSIFFVISRKNISYNKYVHNIAKCTWGIYLLHPFFMNIALKLFKIDLLSGMLYVKFFVFAVILFGASYITTYVLRKMPLVKVLF